MEHIWEHSTRRCSHLALRWKHEIWDASWEFSQRQQVDKDPVLNRIFQGIGSKPPDFLRVEFGFQTSQVEGEAWNNHWLVVWNMNGLWLSIQLGMSSSQLTFTPSFFRGVGSTTRSNWAALICIQCSNRNSSELSNDGSWRRLWWGFMPHLWDFLGSS